MRKVVSVLFSSLDGVVEGPDKWQFDSFDEGMGAAMTELIEAEDAMLLGRVSYEMWLPYWPNYPGGDDQPYADHINNTQKYVVSNTLDKTEWQNSTLVRGADLAATLADLKQRPGGNIGIGGSPTLVQSLLRDNLLDELVLMIHPVVAGTGKRLFPDGDPLKRLQVVKSTTTGSGVLIVTYRPQ